MNWYKIAKDFDPSQVKIFLDQMGLVSEQSNGAITVNRDSIVNNIPAESENEAYDKLLQILGEEFGLRFFYSAKSDDWLLLEHI